LNSYYWQNTLLYLRKNWLELKPELDHSLDSYSLKVVNQIHPKAWLRVAVPKPVYLSATLAKLPRLALAAVRRRLSDN